jgi:hypothetical protein
MQVIVLKMVIHQEVTLLLKPVVVAQPILILVVMVDSFV